MMNPGVVMVVNHNDTDDDDGPPQTIEEGEEEEEASSSSSPPQSSFSLHYAFGAGPVLPEEEEEEEAAAEDTRERSSSRLRPNVARDRIEPRSSSLLSNRRTTNLAPLDPIPIPPPPLVSVIDFGGDGLLVEGDSDHASRNGESLRSLWPPPATPAAVGRRTSTSNSYLSSSSQICSSTSLSSSVIVEKPSPLERQPTDQSDATPKKTAFQESTSRLLLAPFEPEEFVAREEDDEQNNRAAAEDPGSYGSRIAGSSRSALSLSFGVSAPDEVGFAGSRPPPSQSRIAQHRLGSTSFVSKSSRDPGAYNNNDNNSSRDNSRSMSSNPRRHRASLATNSSKSTRAAGGSRSRSHRRSVALDTRAVHVSSNHNREKVDDNRNGTSGRLRGYRRSVTLDEYTRDKAHNGTASSRGRNYRRSVSADDDAKHRVGAFNSTARSYRKGGSADKHSSPSHGAGDKDKRKMQQEATTSAPSSQPQQTPSPSLSSPSNFSDKHSRRLTQSRTRRMYSLAPYHSVSQQSPTTTDSPSSEQTASTASSSVRGVGRFRDSSVAALQARQSRRLKSGNGGVKASIMGGDGRSPTSPLSQSSVKSPGGNSPSQNRPEMTSVLDAKDRLKVRPTMKTSSHRGGARANDQRGQDEEEDILASRPGAFAVHLEDYDEAALDSDHGFHYTVRRRHRPRFHYRRNSDNNFEDEENPAQHEEDYDEEIEQSEERHRQSQSSEGERTADSFRMSMTPNPQLSDDDDDDDGADGDSASSGCFPADSSWGDGRSEQSSIASDDRGHEDGRFSSHRTGRNERTYSSPGGRRSALFRLRHHGSSRSSSGQSLLQSFTNAYRGNDRVRYDDDDHDDSLGNGSVGDDAEQDRVNAYVAPEVVEAHDVDVVNDEDEEETARRSFREAKHVWMLCCFFTLAALVVTPVFIVLMVESGGHVDVTLAPTPSPSLTPSSAPSAVPSSLRFVDIVDALVAQDVLDRSSLEMINATTPSTAYRAVEWLANDDEMQRSPKDSRLLQRYVMSVYYFSIIEKARWEGCFFNAASCVGGDSFLSNTDECEWVGVKCRDGLIDQIGTDQRVWTRAGLTDLTGTLPTEIAKLPRLTSLNLQQSFIGRTIPTEYGNMPLLHTLVLAVNKLTGTIPPTFANNTVLKLFSANRNQLSGTFPRELTLMPNLKELFLASNQFWGPLPDNLGELKSLASLELRNNQFSGPIPSSLGQLKELTSLRLDDNQFTSSVPDSLWQLPRIKLFHLGNNQMTGSIPSLVGSMGVGNRHSANFAKLKFDVSFNLLTGEIPPEIGEFTNLGSAMFQANRFTGDMPREICDLKERFLEELKVDCEDVFCACCEECR